MIDIDHLERRIKYRDEDEPLLPPSPEEVLALIAEIRRLRGERKEHRKCPRCGAEAQMQMGRDDKGRFWWASCRGCHISSIALDSESAAWAAWDGVEP